MGMWPHSGNPGAPLGPQFRITSTVSCVHRQIVAIDLRAHLLGSSRTRTPGRDAATDRGDAAVCLMTAPSGARLPYSTTVPPSGCSGSAAVRITSRPVTFGMLARFRAMVLPVTVSASPCSRCGDLLHHRGHAAGIEQILHQKLARGLDVDDVRRAPRDARRNRRVAARCRGGRRWRSGAPRRWSIRRSPCRP